MKTLNILYLHLIASALTLMIACNDNEDTQMFAGELAGMRALAGNDSAGEDSAGEDSAGEDSAGEDSAGEDSAGEDSAGEASAGEGSAGEDSAGGLPPQTDIRGLKSLYMGHSYFRRQAEAMEEYAEIAGIVDHQSTSLFRGGYNGSAFAIWDDPDSQETIKDTLDAGDIEMFGMTIFVDLEASESEGAHLDNQLQGLKNWIEYAHSKNPETIFFVALPWLGRPLDYVGETGDPQTSGHQAYREAILQSEVGIKALIDELRSAFPDVEIFLLAYGQGSVELRTLYNNGELPDVDTLVSNNGLLGIHRDTHGHAEQMLTDLNTLIWLQSIYNYDVLNFEKEYTYSVDIKQIAHDVASRQDSNYTRQF